MKKNSNTHAHQIEIGFFTVKSVNYHFTGFYRVLLGFNRIALGLTWFYLVLLGFTGFYRVLLCFIEYYQTLPGFTGFYWVLLGFTGFYWVLLGFHWVLPGFTGFYLVLLGFTWFYWVLPSFTGFSIPPLGVGKTRYWSKGDIHGENRESLVASKGFLPSFTQFFNATLRLGKTRYWSRGDLHNVDAHFFRWLERFYRVLPGFSFSLSRATCACARAAGRRRRRRRSIRRPRPVAARPSDAAHRDVFFLRASFFFSKKKSKKNEKPKTKEERIAWTCQSMAGDHGDDRRDARIRRRSAHPLKKTKKNKRTTKETRLSKNPVRQNSVTSSVTDVAPPNRQRAIEELKKNKKRKKLGNLPSFYGFLQPLLGFRRWFDWVVTEFL